MEKFVRKHYRAAQKEVANAPNAHAQGLGKDNKRLLWFGFGLLIAIWLEGLLVGYLIGKNRKRKSRR